MTAAPSRICAARAPAISISFLTAFIKPIGHGRLDDFAAVAGDEARQCVGGGALVDPHAVLSLAQILERARESGRLAQIGECLEAAAHLVRELSAIDVERRPARLRNDGEGERERGVRHIGTADVECPGDRVRVRHDQRVGAQLRRARPDAGELFVGRFAGETQIVQR